MPRKKLKRYQQQLLDLLVGSGWELVAIEKAHDGWTYEHWTIRSVRQKWGYELVVGFVYVHYHWWGITAATSAPHHDQGDELVFARMTLGRGLYNEAITAFVKEIDDHRLSAVRC